MSIKPSSDSGVTFFGAIEGVAILSEVVGAVLRAVFPNLPIAPWMLAAAFVLTLGVVVGRRLYLQSQNRPVSSVFAAFFGGTGSQDRGEISSNKAQILIIGLSDAFHHKKVKEVKDFVDPDIEMGSWRLNMPRDRAHGVDKDIVWLDVASGAEHQNLLHTQLSESRSLIILWTKEMDSESYDWLRGVVDKWAREAPHVPALSLCLDGEQPSSFQWANPTPIHKVHSHTVLFKLILTKATRRAKLGRRQQVVSQATLWVMTTIACVATAFAIYQGYDHRKEFAKLEQTLTSLTQHLDRVSKIARESTEWHVKPSAVPGPRGSLLRIQRAITSQLLRSRYRGDFFVRTTSGYIAPNNTELRFDSSTKSVIGCAVELNGFAYWTAESGVVQVEEVVGNKQIANHDCEYAKIPGDNIHEILCWPIGMNLNKKRSGQQLGWGGLCLSSEVPGSDLAQREIRAQALVHSFAANYVDWKSIVELLEKGDDASRDGPVSDKNERLRPVQADRNN